MIEKEEWRDIKGYEGYYQISNLGNVKSLDRIVDRGNGIFQHRKERIMSKRKNADGYYQAKLNVNKVSKSIGIHILVAEHFLENPNNYSEVNHKDFDRTNNRVDNLEWCTHEYNMRYSKQAGRCKMLDSRYGKDNPNYGNRKLSEFYKQNPEISKIKNSRKGKQNGRCVPVKMIKDDDIRVFDYIGEAAEYVKSLGLTKTCIDKVRVNISKSIKNNTEYLGCRFERINQE